MEDQEILAAPAAENTAPAAEVRLFTQEQVNEIVSRSKARARAKLERELKNRQPEAQPEQSEPEEPEQPASEQPAQIPPEILGGAEFQTFAGKFKAEIPMQEVYSLFAQTRKETHSTMGSMKHTAPEASGVKDFYTYEEASKFTKKDFDANPALFRRVQESMTKWK